MSLQGVQTVLLCMKLPTDANLWFRWISQTIPLYHCVELGSFRSGVFVDTDLFTGGEYRWLSISVSFRWESSYEGRYTLLLWMHRFEKIVFDYTLLKNRVIVNLSSFSSTVINSTTNCEKKFPIQLLFCLLTLQNIFSSAEITKNKFLFLVKDLMSGKNQYFMKTPNWKYKYD